jgi:hypothetical protein
MLLSDYLDKISIRRMDTGMHGSEAKSKGPQHTSGVSFKSVESRSTFAAFGPVVYPATEFDHTDSDAPIVVALSRRGLLARPIFTDAQRC